MTDLTEIISALVLLHEQQLLNQPNRAGGIQDDSAYGQDVDRAAPGDTKLRGERRQESQPRRQPLEYVTVGHREERRQQRIEREVFWAPLLEGIAGEAAPRLINRSKTQPAIPSLAYPPAQAAKVVGRSHTRIKKAIREKELTARKDGRATLIEHAELQRWVASLPTIGREPEPRTLAMSSALEENPRGKSAPDDGEACHDR